MPPSSNTSDLKTDRKKRTRLDRLVRLDRAPDSKSGPGGTVPHGPLQPAFKKTMVVAAGGGGGVRHSAEKLGKDKKEKNQNMTGSK